MRIPQQAAVAVLILATCFAAVVCNAQTATSSLRGTVTDPANAVVGGAAVVLSNPQNGFSQSTTTDAAMYPYATPRERQFWPSVSNDR